MTMEPTLPNEISDAGKGENVRIDPRLSSNLSSHKLWTLEVSLYRMWFEFLSCSPSYGSARRFRMGKPTYTEIINLPADFGSVVSCYDNLGDLNGVMFRDWWNERAKRYFGVESSMPRVAVVGPTHFDEETMDRDELFERFSLFDEDGWARETSQLLIFSTALKRKYVMKQIKSELSYLEFEQKPQDSRKPIYSMGNIGKMRPALRKYLTALKMRGRYPDEELWSIGVRAEVNAVAKSWPRVDDVPQKLGPDECQLMSIITSRALFRAKMISEHAARGMFPIHTKFANAAPKFILTDLSKKVRGLDEMNSKEKMEREQTERDLQALMIEYGVQNRRD